MVPKPLNFSSLDSEKKTYPPLFLKDGHGRIFLMNSFPQGSGKLLMTPNVTMHQSFSVVLLLVKSMAQLLLLHNQRTAE